MKNLKHAAEEIGFPGRPKNAVFLFLNFDTFFLIAIALHDLNSCKIELI